MNVDICSGYLYRYSIVSIVTVVGPSLCVIVVMAIIILIFRHQRLVRVQGGIESASYDVTSGQKVKLLNSNKEIWDKTMKISQ